MSVWKVTLVVVAAICITPCTGFAKQPAAQTTSPLDLPEGQSQEDILNSYEELKPGEECTDEVTGQFWYKVCTPTTTMEDCEIDQWVICWVWDPEQCCNVAKRKKMKVPSKCPKTTYEETMVCAQVTLPKEAVKQAPPCDCKELPVPYNGPNTKPTGAMGGHAGNLKRSTPSTGTAQVGRGVFDVEPSQPHLSKLYEAARPVTQTARTAPKTPEVKSRQLQQVQQPLQQQPARQPVQHQTAKVTDAAPVAASSTPQPVVYYSVPQTYQAPQYVQPVTYVTYEPAYVSTPVTYSYQPVYVSTPTYYYPY